MFQFKPYPIHVVYSRHWQEQIPNSAADFYVAGDNKMGDWMRKTGRSLMEIVEDSAPAYTAERLAWEQTMRSLLEKINKNIVGRMVLELLKPEIKVYILPDPDLFWAAVTHPMKTAKEGGGIRIHFNPEQWPGVADDTLAHELVHAMRQGNSRVIPYAERIKDWPNLDEFLATQVQNVYRSANGSKQLYDTYTYFQGKFASKGSIYSEFVHMEYAEPIRAIKNFMLHEPLAKKLAYLPVVHPEFNPFRDLPVFERMVLGRFQEPGSAAGTLVPY